MEPTPVPTPVSKQLLWAGRLLSTPPVLLLLMSGVMKLTQNADVVKGFAGWPDGIAIPIGLVELTCTAISLVTRTSVLGALLLTGYLGGATATVVHAGQSSFAFMTVGLGVLLWGGLWLRDPRLRALMPLKN